MSALPQPHASTSKSAVMGNPQLGPEPVFAYPTPTPEQVEEELPPGFEGDLVPLGPMLDRVVRRGYGELRGLAESTLPSISDRQKPQPIIQYARTTRQSILKYLAVLRWKAQVDVPIYAALNGNAAGTSPARTNGTGHPAASFPTPHSNNGSSDSPDVAAITGYGGNGKGKGRAMDDVIRGKITDAKRIEVFMGHQNAQHSAAVEHLRHTSKVVDGLRMRNPDLLTAMSVLSLGTYPRLPTELIDTFTPKPLLTNRLLLTTLRKLNRHIRFRLKCVDYVPSDLVILEIKDGRVYLQGEGGEWRAELTIINFGHALRGADGGEEQGRWWLTGVEWGWREKEEKGVDDPGGKGNNSTTRRRLDGEERKAVLDLANMEILPPRPVPDGGVGIGTGSGVPDLKAETVSGGEKKRVDAPLVRIHNFLQHLSLTYQLEVLHTQAMVLANGKWRGQLAVEMDRGKKVLTLRYWLRPRPPAPPPPPQSGPRRPAPPVPDSRTPLVGGILRIALLEDSKKRNEAESLLAEVGAGAEGIVPAERLLRMRLGVKWELGEIGEAPGGATADGWKVGNELNSAGLEIDPSQLSIADILTEATREHAVHLTRSHCAPLLTSARIGIFPNNPPTLVDTHAETSTRPLSMRVPLPGRQRSTAILVGISALTGLIEIEDEGAVPIGMEDRGKRAKMACGSVNEGKTRLGDDIGRLITAIITENIEGQMRALGHTPTRRLPLRSQDMAKADLHPASSIFLPLPNSANHHLVTRITGSGVVFEVLQLVKVQAENGAGWKLGIGERVGIDRGLIIAGAGVSGEAVLPQDKEGSAFELEEKHLRDVFIYSNALVAQSIIESQLKSRHIPYTLCLPSRAGPGAPKSRSPLAGLIPTFTVRSAYLLMARQTGARAEAGEVAMPRVWIQVGGWWKGGKCSAVTVVQLRHRPSTPTSGPSGSSATGTSATTKSDGITFDQASSVVKFHADDLDNCVKGFLEQWERLSKVIIVAGTVNKLNKLPLFKDVRMLSFDLRTATLEYAPGYLCEITYDSGTDGYVVSFGRTGPADAAAAGRAVQGVEENGAGEAVNPHEAMKGLLSWELNELVEGQKDVGVRFIGLLRATLPFLLESAPPGPQLVILSVRRYRLIWDIQSTRRFGVEFTLLPNNQSWVISDAAASPMNGVEADGRCGPLEEIRGFPDVVGSLWESLRGASEKKEVAALGGEAGEETKPDMRSGGGGSEMTAMKLDQGGSLWISGESGVVRDAIKGMVGGVGDILGDGK
ncbi:mediator complex subunit MED14-domain-containing protein [Dioszegia hungarica]|uniref:Mediator of RNA polymerase II transcription subunit 14 n=1 Tax=Dioszegia hungarica TaxID=4972 RepID=A0AA38LT04_9TREE|nr:mediator complex subunit MED14-domain-containing protein [Dioszegia hungarica]KAI9633134.1 mediator complex subunit MED14-domain-containing protein [Dioszegia hungarica]